MKALKAAWESGGIDTQFVRRHGGSSGRQYQEALLDHSPVALRRTKRNYRAWSKQFAQWLFGTDHIAVRYGIAYRRRRHPQALARHARHRSCSSSTSRSTMATIGLYHRPARGEPRPQVCLRRAGALFLAAKRSGRSSWSRTTRISSSTRTRTRSSSRRRAHAPGELPPISYVSGGLETAIFARRSATSLKVASERSKKEHDAFACDSTDRTSKTRFISPTCFTRRNAR